MFVMACYSNVNILFYMHKYTFESSSHGCNGVILMFLYCFIYTSTLSTVAHMFVMALFLC